MLPARQGRRAPAETQMQTAELDTYDYSTCVGR